MVPQKKINWALFVLLALVWGSSFILMKKSAAQLTGWQIGAVRILSAGLVFMPMALTRLSKVPKGKLPYILLTGFLGNLFPAFLFGLAIKNEGESSLAGILNSLTPLFVVLIGALFFQTPVASKKVAGVVIGFAGLVLLSFSRGPVTAGGLGALLLILLATIFYGLNVNIIGRHLKGVDPLLMASVSLSFLTLPTVLVLVLNPIGQLTSAPVLHSIGTAVLLGLMGSAAATALFYILIKRAGGLFASLVTYAIPIVAIGWGLLDGETIGLSQVGCLGIILVGVWLANK